MLNTSIIHNRGPQVRTCPGDADEASLLSAITLEISAAGRERERWQPFRIAGGAVVGHDEL
jgi:hypothetical protein